MNGNDKGYAKTNGNSKIHVIISAANDILGNDRGAAELEKFVRCESGDIVLYTPSTIHS